jgi:hypothetical protein
LGWQSPYSHYPGTGSRDRTEGAESFLCVLAAVQLRACVSLKSSGHIWGIMPFDNTVVIGTFKRRDLPAVVVGDRHVEPDRDYTLAVSDYTAENQATQEICGPPG